MTPAPDLAEVPYSLIITTRADGVVRARPRGTRLRTTVLLLFVCAAPALYLWRGQGWSGGGTGPHTGPGIMWALLAMGMSISFLWRYYCASQIIFSSTSVLVAGTFVRARIPLSHVEGFDQNKWSGAATMRVRGNIRPLMLFRPQGARDSADWLNAMLLDALSDAVTEVPKFRRRVYFAFSDLALVASAGIAACVLLAR
ncbi:hypothetical protein [Streptomyces sp. NPDC002690]